ncbi:hypothetical protein [Mariniflexile sp.]|uniref:hypothetical protein n=1 Tax=Mariniflexile sp. TaxID=1979402 RepID=UPI00356A351C
MKSIYTLIFKCALIACFFITYSVKSQVGIGTNSPDSSSMLDIQSSSKGILIPRMDSTQRMAIASPVTGLLVFDTTTQSFWFYKTSWTELSDNAPDKMVNEEGDTRIEVEKTPDDDKIRFTTNGSERMTIDDAGNTRFGDGTNNTYIGSDGSLSFEGTATRFDDLKVPVNTVQIKKTDITDVEYDVFKDNTAALFFPYNKEPSVVFSVQLPHGWKEGSTIYPHVHWSSKSDVGSNTVVWALEYTWTNVGAVFPNTTTVSGSTLVPSNGGSVSAYEHAITPLGAIDGTGKEISSMLMCRLYRYTTNASDTFNDYVALLEIDFHYEIDSDGSRTEYAK